MLESVKTSLGNNITIIQSLQTKHLIQYKQHLIHVLKTTNTGNNFITLQQEKWQK